MNPLAFGLMGFNFAMWLTAFNLLGIGAASKEGGPSPTKTVGAAGSLAGAITLVFAAMWFVVGQPFGKEAGAVHALFSSITGMYGLLWIGVFAVQVFNFDWQPIANLCLLLALIQAIQIIGVFHLLGTTSIHVWIVNAVLASYIVVLIMFWRLLYGKLAARPVGWWGIVTVIGTIYLQFFGGGIFPTP